MRKSNSLLLESRRFVKPTFPLDLEVPSFPRLTTQVRTIGCRYFGLNCWPSFGWVNFVCISVVCLSVCLFNIFYIFKLSIELKSIFSILNYFWFFLIFHFFIFLPKIFLFYYTANYFLISQQFVNYEKYFWFIDNYQLCFFLW